MIEIGRHITLTLLVGLALAACATQATDSGGPDRPDQGGGRVLPDIGPLPDVAPRNDGGADAADDATDGAPADTRDAPGDALADASVDSSFDTTADIGPTDTGTDSADGECLGRGCPCTISTRGLVCGTLACVDGVCCESACAGACVACDIAGSEGTCSAYDVGTDPDDDCSPQSPSTCGRNGECDGAGACAFYGDEISCDDGESCSVDDVCNGTGGCAGKVPATCGPGAGNVCCVGTCSDGAGCATTASACADVCGSTTLTIGASCAGCGAPGAVGVCGGGGTHRCDETDHSVCQELTCGGVRYWCTDSADGWGWRPVGACDDGNACTYGDACAAGVCSGNPVNCDDTLCADRECNGTATCTMTPHPGVACDDGVACTYNDTCNAAGTCVAGPTLTCADAPCIDRECTGGPTCRETVLTGSSCNDGNACTYDDRCGADAVCVGGSSLDCSGRDTACLSYACNGTASCAATPRNIGGACDDGDPATDLDLCNASGVCEGDTGCPPPAAACAAGTQNRRGCGNARVISRLAAGAGSGHVIRDDTCSARDDLDDSSGCWDANSDHTYRLYMREGEAVRVRYVTEESCPSSDWSTWSGTLKIFETGGCDNLTCGSKVYCDYNEDDQTANYTARQDGWIMIVADGSHAFGDEGDYALTVTLTCRAGDCTCR